MACATRLPALLIILTGFLVVHVSAAERAQATHICTKTTVAATVDGKPTTEVVNQCDAHVIDTSVSTTASHSDEDEPTCEESLAEHLDLLGIDVSDSDYQCGFTVYPTSEDEAEITLGLIQHAMESFAIPAPELVIQPPDGKTLVNFETNFYTEADVIHRSTTLLGQDIDFRIFPDSYTWHFGDGEAVTTASPGAPYPDLDVTHKYLKKGTYQPSLETTYTADYRVNGGAWQPVPGSLVLADEPQQLEAVTARPILVAPDGRTTS